MVTSLVLIFGSGTGSGCSGGTRLETDGEVEGKRVERGNKDCEGSVVRTVVKKRTVRGRTEIRVRDG